MKPHKSIYTAQILPSYNKHFNDLFIFAVLCFFEDGSSFRIGHRDIRSSAHESRDEEFVTVNDRMPQSSPTVTVAKVKVTPCLEFGQV